MTVNTASRFQVVDTLVRNPGETMITKSTQGPFIDAGLDFGLGDRPFFRGRVYLSKDEVREMAEQLGLFDEERAVALQGMILLQAELTLTVEAHDQAVADAEAVGYAAGRAENLDHLADELVDRMRARVSRPAADVASDEVAGEDGAAAAAPAAPSAAAPVVEEPDGVQRPAVDHKPKPGPRT